MMNGKEYLIKNIQDSDINEVIRIACCLDICANEFFPKTHSETCNYSKTKNIKECEECWRYALDQEY
jgi:hypothetical protein